MILISSSLHARRPMPQQGVTSRPRLGVALLVSLCILSGGACADEGADPLAVAAPQKHAMSVSGPVDLEGGTGPAPAPTQVGASPAAASQAAARHATPPQPGAKGEDGDKQEDASFNAALKAFSPLTPDQIGRFQVYQDDLARAKESRKAPESKTISLPVSLDPGQEPPTIMLADGYTTALSILDSTGQPWPALGKAIGDDSAFTAVLPKNPGNVLLVSVTKPYARSNLVLLLKGASSPITLNLDSSRDRSFFGVNLIVGARGPNAVAPTSVPPPPPTDDAYMDQLLDGIVGSGIRQVGLTGGNATAYIAGNKFYIRTSMTIVLPAPIASIHSANVGVYELPITPTVTCYDDLGQAVELHPDQTTLIDGSLAVHSTSLSTLKN